MCSNVVAVERELVVADRPLRAPVVAGRMPRYPAAVPTDGCD
jgi:hypothetical protein